MGRPINLKTRIYCIQNSVNAKKCDEWDLKCPFYTKQSMWSVFVYRDHGVVFRWSVNDNWMQTHMQEVKVLLYDIWWWFLGLYSYSLVLVLMVSPIHGHTVIDISAFFCIFLNVTTLCTTGSIKIDPWSSWIYHFSISICFHNG